MLLSLFLGPAVSKETEKDSSRLNDVAGRILTRFPKFRPSSSCLLRNFLSPGPYRPSSPLLRIHKFFVFLPKKQKQTHKKKTQHTKNHKHKKLKLTQKNPHKPPKTKTKKHTPKTQTKQTQPREESYLRFAVSIPFFARGAGGGSPWKVALFSTFLGGGGKSRYRTFFFEADGRAQRCVSPLQFFFPSRSFCVRDRGLFFGFVTPLRLGCCLVSLFWLISNPRKPLFLCILPAVLVFCCCFLPLFIAPYAILAVLGSSCPFLKRGKCWPLFF